ncbi:MAG: arginine--tRNA ligase [Sphaerochaetaceae bacterium]|nr:arginine--tRNA ligase [Sphaerochaetaceae bacterium]
MINKAEWKQLVQTRLQRMYETSGHEGTLSDVVLQIPPKPEMGDLAFPLFAFAKAFGKAPNMLAQQLADDINALEGKPDGEAFCAGPYMNVRLNMDKMVSDLYANIVKTGASYGKTGVFEGKKVMIEFSCPNTNKPLHLGHVRNDCIGQSMSQILKAGGAEVLKVNLINNRGVHICKSMLAYQKFGGGETPKSSGIKGDHLVGNYYVRFAQWEKEVLDKDTATFMAQGMSEDDAKAKAKAVNAPDLEAQDMLRAWEQGDPEVMDLWRKMNQWTLDGVAQTYENTGISFDKYYYESDTYKLGKDKVLEGLEKGVFQKQKDGAIYIDNSDIGLDKKILLRKDGTSIYITQDIGTAINRHEDWPFDSLVYVVASEQRYHFKVLFHVLDKLGYDWAQDLHHLSYGMVFLPEGKMKSREGTVVDADDLIKSLTEMAKAEIVEKGRDSELEDVDATAHSIALGALNYYILQFDPTKDFVFNPKESLSFNGNTGPYLQYMGARISSMLRKYDEVRSDYDVIPFDPAQLSLEDERELIKMIGSFPETVTKACKQYDPSIICAYLYDMSKKFSHWYHDNQILKAETASLVKARVCLCEMVLQTMKNAFDLVGIPFLEKM